MDKHSEDDLLGPLIDDDSALRNSFRRRRDKFDYQRVHAADADGLVSEGWQLHKALKSAVWMKREKPASRLLEDRLWCLLYRLGYPTLSGPRFRIKYKRADGTLGAKEIDVFSQDAETAIVIECKARREIGRRTLQKDIHETENLQKLFSKSIRSHFGREYNPKIIWIYATENIIWNEKDVERADAANIRIVTENEIQYFEAFVAHIGSAGRYQFLAEFLENQEIPGLANVKVPASRGYFGKHRYYSFAVTARHLLKIAFINHQALNNPEGKPAYQRMINKKRIVDIGAFIQRGGFFPTNILLNFVDSSRFDLMDNKDNKNIDNKFGWLYLPNKYKSAWVVDGQHRLYGFSNIPDKFLDTTLFVLAFEKMDNRTEAELFITINHEQRSVSKSLLVTLQADLRLGSNDPREAVSALASALIRSLSNDNTSPFFRRFEIPGVTPTESQNLTIAEAVKGATRSTLLGRVLPKKSRVPGYLSGQTDADTLLRARRVLNGYFRAVMDANPDRWRRGRSAHVCVNPGIRAHFSLLQEILKFLDARGQIDALADPPERLVEAAVQFAKPLLDFISTASDKEIESSFSRKFGEGGVAEYFFNMCGIVSRKNKEFGTEEFKRYVEQQKDSRVAQAERDLIDLQGRIVEVVVESLKRIHGTQELPSGEKAYWDLGIENQDIKQNAYKKQQSAPVAKRAPKEAYLDLIDFEKILKQPNNWPTFEPIFSIPLTDEQRNKKYYLAWLERLNELRRIPAHKSPYRTFSEDDFSFVTWLKAELYDRFTKAGIVVD